MSRKNSPNTDFGTFMSSLAGKATPVTQAAVDALKEKMAKEQAEKVELAARRIFANIERNVEELRRVRRQEKVYLKNIADAEEAANKLVSGEASPDQITSYGTFAEDR